ncbi:MAG: replication protein [Acidobacteriota bacterium]|nr:replication protein [Acidobacteriota bacterium]
MKTEKRKYRGIEDLYVAEDELRTEREKGRTTPASLPISNSLPESNSLPNISRLLPKDEVACRNNSLPESNSLLISNNQTESQRSPDGSLKLMESLPEASGYMKFWHELTDHLYQHLTPSEQVVHLQLYRLSWGHGKSTCEIGLPRLSARAGIGRSTAQQAINGLVRKGLVKKLKMIIGSNKEQGIEYYIEPTPSQVKSGRLPDFGRLPKSGSLPKSTPIKENTQKENTHTHEKPAAGVRVGSKFSIEECRNYAKHLQATGQGITNPGGYATTIHRTGEADLLIDGFLHPETTSLSATLDTSQCPDCQGTGFYYPQGVEAGVARCKHDQLRREGK